METLWFMIVAVMVASVTLSGITATTIGEGLAGLVGHFLSRLLPSLRWDALFAGRDTHGSVAA